MNPRLARERVLKKSLASALLCNLHFVNLYTNLPTGCVVFLVTPCPTCIWCPDADYSAPALCTTDTFLEVDDAVTCLAVAACSHPLSTHFWSARAVSCFEAHQPHCKDFTPEVPAALRAAPVAGEPFARPPREADALLPSPRLRYALNSQLHQ